MKYIALVLAIIVVYQNFDLVKRFAAWLYSKIAG